MRHAARSLIHSPGLSSRSSSRWTCIGANTAVFSVLRGAPLRPLPHEGGDRLLYLKQSATRTGQQKTPRSRSRRSWTSCSQARSLAAVAEFSSLTFNLIGAGEPVQVQAGIVTGNFFEAMGLGAVVGRTFDQRDDGSGAPPRR